MKKIILAFITILVCITVIFLFNRVWKEKNSLQQKTEVTESPQSIPSPTSTVATLRPPLNKAAERVTKKKFGTYVTPANSPVQPERFQGYHVGVDFEVFPEEISTEVTVHAVCTGTLRLKEYASGYGGVAVENCQLNGEPITVIYGHIRLASVQANSGDSIKVGDEIGVLGADHSSDTDGERKHLHLGFHKGDTTDIRGYVSSESELSNWIDPCLYVCHN